MHYESCLSLASTACTLNMTVWWKIISDSVKSVHGATEITFRAKWVSMATPAIPHGTLLNYKHFNFNFNTVIRCHNPPTMFLLCFLMQVENEIYITAILAIALICCIPTTFGQQCTPGSWIYLHLRRCAIYRPQYRRPKPCLHQRCLQFLDFCLCRKCFHHWLYSLVRRGFQTIIKKLASLWR